MEQRPVETFVSYHSVDGEPIRVHAVLDYRRNPTWIGAD